jgi:hypothetical protein
MRAQRVKPERGNVVLLDHYYSPEELEREIASFVTYYNDARSCLQKRNVQPKIKLLRVGTV